MFIKKLQIGGFRSIDQAEFIFEPTGMNLLVGVNGVGKTTVLDALRICLSRVLPEITASRSQKHNFKDLDIKQETDTLEVLCTIDLEGIPFNILIRKYRQKPTNVESGKLTVQVLGLEDIQPELSKVFHGEKLSQQPLAVYFSTKRSLITEQRFSIAGTVGKQAAAFADSLSANRGLNLQIFAEWFKAQEELGKENPISLKHIEALRKAVSEFLPGFQNLRITGAGGKVNFLIDKNGVPFRLAQLSDGERGVLAIVLDLARRLSQANPGLEDPVKDGSAIVLIDELDLHLHPKWQRSVVENLTRTFQNCQFIASTHSPQIIGEVKPERITIIGESIYQPASSFGMDSSRVLEEIMDTASRNAGVDDILTALSEKIDSEDLPAAKKLLDKLKKVIGPTDPEVIRSATMINFLEDEIEQ